MAHSATAFSTARTQLECLSNDPTRSLSMTRSGDDAVREREDEYTLSAYGDIPLGEAIVPLPSPRPSPLQPKASQPRLRLKVRRPPMPKRRLGYVYVSNPSSPRAGGLESDKRWPGNPRSAANSHQHQPLTAPLASPGGKSARNVDASSLASIVDKLLPATPSIRLSPPGSPANKALGLPRETEEWHAKPSQVPQSPPAPQPVPRQEKPWRSRLPPRLPIPKWDL